MQDRVLSCWRRAASLGLLRPLELDGPHHHSAQHHEHRLRRDVQAKELEDHAEELRRQGQPGVCGQRVQVTLSAGGAGHEARSRAGPKTEAAAGADRQEAVVPPGTPLRGSFPHTRDEPPHGECARSDSHLCF